MVKRNVANASPAAIRLEGILRRAHAYSSLDPPLADLDQVGTTDYTDFRRCRSVNEFSPLTHVLSNIDV